MFWVFLSLPVQRVKSRQRKQPASGQEHGPSLCSPERQKWASQACWTTVPAVWLSAVAKLPSVWVHNTGIVKKHEVHTLVGGDTMTVVYRWEVAIEHPNVLEGEELSKSSQVLLQPLSTVVCVGAATGIYRGWIERAIGGADHHRHLILYLINQSIKSNSH